MSLFAVVANADDMTIIAGWDVLIDTEETVDRLTIRSTDGLNERGKLTIRGASGFEPGFLTATYVRNLGLLQIENGGGLDTRLDLESYDETIVDGRLNVGGNVRLSADGRLVVWDDGAAAVAGSVLSAPGGLLQVAGDVNVAGAVHLTTGGVDVEAAGTVRTAGKIHFDSGGGGDVAGRLIADTGPMLFDGADVTVRDGGLMQATAGEMQLSNAADVSISGTAIAGGALRATHADTLVEVASGGFLSAERFLLSDDAEMSIFGTAVAAGAVTADGAQTALWVKSGGALFAEPIDLTGGATLTVGDPGAPVAGTLNASTLTVGDGMTGGTFDLAGAAEANAVVVRSDGVADVYGTLVTDALTSAGNFDLQFDGLLDGGAGTFSGLTTLHGGSVSEFDRLAVTGSTFTLQGEATVDGAVQVAGADTTLAVGEHAQFRADSLSVTDGTANLDGDVTLSDKAAVAGFGAELNVTGGEFQADALHVHSQADATIAGRAIVDGETVVEDTLTTLTVEQDGRLDTERLLVDGGALLSVHARTDGTADGRLHVADRTIVSATDATDASGLEIAGVASLGQTTLFTLGGIDVRGTADTRDAFGILRAVAVEALATVSVIGDGVLTAGDLTLHGRLESDGGAALTAAAVTIKGGDADLYGTTQFDSLSIESGDARLFGNAAIDDATLHDGSLTLDGQSTFGALTTNGGAVTVSGLAEIDRLTVGGGTFDVDNLSRLEVHEATRVTGGTVTLSDDAALGATTVSGGTLAVQADVETDSDVDASGPMHALTIDGGAVHVSPDGALTAGDLAIGGDGDLTVDADGELTAGDAVIGDGTGGTLTANGATQLGATSILADGTLTADALLQTDSLRNAGALSVRDGGAMTTGAALFEAGAALFQGTATTASLTVTGGTLDAYQSFTTTGDATFAGGASVLHDSAALGGLLISDGTLSTNVLTVADGTTLSGGTLTLDGVAGLSATSVTGGSLIVSRQASTRADFDDAGSPLQRFTLGEAGAVTVADGGSLFASTLTTAGTFDLAGELGLGESLEITGGSLTMASTAWIHTEGANGIGLTMTGGAANFDGEVDLTGALLVDGAGTVMTVADFFQAETLTVTDGARATVADGGSLRLFGDDDGPTPLGLTVQSGGALKIEGTAGLRETFVGADSTLTVAGLANTGSTFSNWFTRPDEDLTVDGTVAVTTAGRLFSDAIHVRPTGTLTAGGVTLATAVPGTEADALALSAGTLFGQSLVVDGVAALGDTTVADGGKLTVGGAARTAADFAAGSTLQALSVADGGSLTVTSDGALAAGALSIAGEVTVAGDAGGRGSLVAESVALHAGGALTIDGGLVTAGALDAHEDGDLTVTSDGVFSLLGDATFKKDVALNGGLAASSVVIDENGTLHGAGTLLLTGEGSGDGLTVRGRIAPGNSPGVMTIAGNATFAPTAIFDIELVATPADATPVAGTDFDRIAVTGAAIVDGGTLNALPFGPSTDYAVGTRYDYLVAANGVTVRALPRVADPLGDVRFAQIVTPNSLGLVVARDGSIATLGTTWNQTAVGGALDAAASDPATRPLRNTLDTLPDAAAVRRALATLSGELYGSHLTATNRSSLLFLDQIAGPAAGPRGCEGCRSCRSSHEDYDGLSGWTETFGAGGRIGGDGNASRVAFGNAGTAVGLTRTLGNGEAGVRLGTFYGYESLTTRVDAAAASATTDVHRLGVRGALRLGPLRASAASFVGFTETDARRDVLVANPNFPIADRLASEFNGTLAAGDAELGWLFEGDHAAITPFVGLRYVRSDRGKIVERGGGAALALADASLSELRVRLGARGAVLLPVAAPARLTLEAFYSRDVSAGTVGETRARFAAAPTAAWIARGVDFRADRVVLRPGVALGDGPIRLYAGYSAGLTDRSVLHAGDVRMELSF